MPSSEVPWAKVTINADKMPDVITHHEEHHDEKFGFESEIARLRSELAECKEGRNYFEDVAAGLRDERPAVEKFHDDHKQMCEICRGLDEALVDAHAHLSDRVAEVEQLRALAEQRLKDREYWQERNAEKETENDRLRKDLARAEDRAK
jgi:chromosome segregation ATPase